jgi:cysteine desulfurase
MKNSPIYFDNAATTPLHPKALERMLPFLSESFGNPSSIHSYGRKVRVAVEEAREVIANSINAKPGEIYFVSGGTEANNMALFGIGKTEFNESGRNKIISSKAEHHSVIESLEELSKLGFDISLTDANDDSTANLEKLINPVDEKTSLISVMHVNNETGSINDIKSIAEQGHRKNIIVHSDAVQSFCKIPIDVKQLGVDALSVSSHKIRGPKGAGALYVKSGTPLSPIIYGGSQERNRRGGTENPAAIVGFAEAVKIALSEMNDNFEYVKKLSDTFVKGIEEIDPAGIIINSRNNNFPYIINITLSSSHYRNDSEAILMYLDINGIAASNGAACTSGTLKPSHVILSMGKSVEDANGTIRFSLGRQNTPEEVEYALTVLEKMSRKFRV